MLKINCTKNSYWYMWYIITVKSSLYLPLCICRALCDSNCWMNCRFSSSGLLYRHKKKLFNKLLCEMGQLPLQVCSWKACQHLPGSAEQQGLTICSCSSLEKECCVYSFPILTFKIFPDRYYGSKLLEICQNHLGLFNLKLSRFWTCWKGEMDRK